ncbi:MAG: tRNA lysidine(34) synthetase TilS [Gemella sp.]|nr:tRNA lysidine(34) synthetase TilS [Gemella sp.]
MKINILWKKEDKLALTLSTGVDSIVLLNLLLTDYKDTYKELVIFHVNHGFREESEEEAVFAQNLAASHGLKFYKKDLNLNEVQNSQHISQEMLAREARYKAFEEFAKQSDIKLVLTGHHKNDNVENILMRILSSRNVNHQLDIAEKVARQNFILLRPMLSLSKQEIESYAKENKLEYRQDLTNFDTKYTRNYIRQELVPNFNQINPSAEDNMVEFAQHYKELQDYAKETFEKKLAAIDLKIEPDKVTINIEDYFNFSDLEKNFYINKILNENLGQYRVTRGAIKTAINKINQATNNLSLDLKEDIKIIKEYQSIYISKIQKKCYNDKIVIDKENLENIYDFTIYQIGLSTDNQEAEYGFNEADFPLVIRTKREGDRIQRGLISKKLSRLFIDYKIEKSKRNLLPVIEDKDGNIKAVLGLGNKVSKTKKYDYYIKILRG